MYSDTITIELTATDKQVIYDFIERHTKTERNKAGIELREWSKDLDLWREIPRDLTQKNQNGYGLDEQAAERLANMEIYWEIIELDTYE
jgi:hypothetical protein